MTFFFCVLGGSTVCFPVNGYTFAPLRSVNLSFSKRRMNKPVAHQAMSVTRAIVIAVDRETGDQCAMALDRHPFVQFVVSSFGYERLRFY